MQKKTEQNRHMMHCESCGSEVPVPGYDIVNCGSVEHGDRQLCNQCFNAEVASTQGAESLVQGTYTAKQGQYLAFIYYYTKIHGRSPSEADMQGYFRVSPPSVHQMVLSLEKLGFIEGTPGQGRSLKLLLPREQLPDLI